MSLTLKSVLDDWFPTEIVEFKDGYLCLSNRQFLKYSSELDLLKSLIIITKNGYKARAKPFYQPIKEEEVISFYADLSFQYELMKKELTRLESLETLLSWIPS